MATTVEIADDLSLVFRAIPGGAENDAYRIAVSWEARFDELAAELVDEAIDDVVDATDGIEHGEEYRVYFLKETTPEPHQLAAETAETIAGRAEELYDDYRDRYDSADFDREMRHRGF